MLGCKIVCHAARIFSSFRIPTYTVLQPVYLIKVSTLLLSPLSLLFTTCELAFRIWALVCGYGLQYHCSGQNLARSTNLTHKQHKPLRGTYEKARSKKCETDDEKRWY